MLTYMRMHIEEALKVALKGPLRSRYLGTFRIAATGTTGTM